MKLKHVHLIFLGLLTLWLSSVTLTQAAPRLAVGLSEFSATATSDGIRLYWKTGSEVNTAAFIIQRKTSATDFVDLTNIEDENGSTYPGGAVEATGSPTIGDEYIAVDTTAVNNQTYTYQLVEIEANNSRTPLESRTITAGATATPTPISVGGNPTVTPRSNQNSPTNTATAVPSNTATATSVPATNTPTRIFLAPTNTPIPTNTPANIVSAAPLEEDESTPTPLPSPRPTAVETATAETVAQTQATPEDGYPEPVSPTAVPGSEEATYPEETQPLNAPGTTTPYPLMTARSLEGPTPTIVAVIGDQTNQINDNDTAAANQSQTQSSSAVLWVGFIAALIIFILAIGGSIALFVRKRE